MHWTESTFWGFSLCKMRKLNAIIYKLTLNQRLCHSNEYDSIMRAGMLSHILYHVRLFGTPWTIACQAPLFMGFSRQEQWNGFAMLSSRGSFQPRSWTQVSSLLCLRQVGSLPLASPGKLWLYHKKLIHHKTPESKTGKHKMLRFRGNFSYDLEVQWGISMFLILW